MGKKWKKLLRARRNAAAAAAATVVSGTDDNTGTETPVVEAAPQKAPKAVKKKSIKKAE